MIKEIKQKRLLLKADKYFANIACTFKSISLKNGTQYCLDSKNGYLFHIINDNTIVLKNDIYLHFQYLDIPIEIMEDVVSKYINLFLETNNKYKIYNE